MRLTQNLEHILHDMVTENHELTQQLRRKGAELTRAEETIRREQAQNQYIRQQVSMIVYCVVSTYPKRGYSCCVSMHVFACSLNRLE